jgi:hypothetical protein
MEHHLREILDPFENDQCSQQKILLARNTESDTSKAIHEYSPICYPDMLKRVKGKTVGYYRGDLRGLTELQIALGQVRHFVE